MDYNIINTKNDVRLLWYIIIATKPHPNLDRLKKLCSDKGIKLIILGMGDNRLQCGCGFGARLQYIHEFVKKLYNSGHTNDLILLTDAYDVLIIDDLQTIVNKYE